MTLFVTKSTVSELVVLIRHLARRQSTAGHYTSLLTSLGITLAYGIHMLAYGEITETNLLIAVDMNTKTNVRIEHVINQKTLLMVELL